MSDHLPVTEPVLAVQRLLIELVAQQFSESSLPASRDANEQWQCAQLLARSAIDEASVPV
ncbi:hypothetical protein [Pseudomonas sp. TH31]|uniref:hypothetical protein n=1 Tax=Pseudomonas sp. TH31 TaxID=2796396 RepID=UPI001911CB5D|nr:hypothetical protein [Pseudomonas sp. TH31]MBK5416073.1 hypothetical protein [Pseudomonas sp. TH31]